MELVCPTCGTDETQVNSTGEELLCKNGHMLAVYDKARHRLIPIWWAPP